MSDSWIAFQPAIEEPSNIMPSANVSSSIMEMSKVTCCHLPRGSVKRKSAYLTSFSLISFRTSLAVVMECIPFLRNGCGWGGGRPRSSVRGPSGSNCVDPGFPGSNPDRFLDVGDENLPIADPPGLGGATDRLNRFLDHLIGEHNLDFHLGEKIDDILGAAVKLGVALLPSEALGLGHLNAL